MATRVLKKARSLRYSSMSEGVTPADEDAFREVDRPVQILVGPASTTLFPAPAKERPSLRRPVLRPA